MEIEIVWLVVVLCITLSFSEFIITNGPNNTTVCINNTAEINCGFTGANYIHIFPDWIVINRSDNGSILSNFTYNNNDVQMGRIGGLKWVPGNGSTNNNSSNSKLSVGPVNKTHDQSSYQCSFREFSERSTVGTITVVDPPTVVINVDKNCTTYITISLNTSSPPECGNVSHNVTSTSGNVTINNTTNGTKYTIKELQNDTLYNITVTSTYSGGLLTKSRSRPVMPSLPKSPNPIDNANITLEKTGGNITITWKPPEIDNCSMLAVKCYDVKICSREIPMYNMSGRTNNTTISFKCPDNNSRNITVNVTVTVVDIKGQRSTSTVAKNITGTTGNKDSDKNIGSNVLTVILLLLLSLSLWLLL